MSINCRFRLLTTGQLTFIAYMNKRQELNGDVILNPSTSFPANSLANFGFVFSSEFPNDLVLRDSLLNKLPLGLRKMNYSMSDDDWNGFCINSSEDIFNLCDQFLKSFLSNSVYSEVVAPSAAITGSFKSFLKFLLNCEERNLVFTYQEATKAQALAENYLSETLSAALNIGLSAKNFSNDSITLFKNELSKISSSKLTLDSTLDSGFVSVVSVGLRTLYLEAATVEDKQLIQLVTMYFQSIFSLSNVYANVIR